MTPGEHWLPIPGYEGLYDVSDLGNVRSWHRTPTDAPRPLSPTASAQTHYPMLRLYKDGRGASKNVHALVLLAFCGPRPAGMVTRHLNGDRADCRRSNLAYGTASENNLDAVRHGTHHWASKTHCPAGHEYTEDNIYRHANGGRCCRRCTITRANEWNRRHKKSAVAS